MLARANSLAFRLVAGAAILVSIGLLLGSYSLSLVFESRLTFALLHAEADVIRRRYIRR